MRDLVLLVRVVLRQCAFVAERLVGWDEDGVVAETAGALGLAGHRAGEASQLGRRPPVGQDERGGADERRRTVLVADVAELGEEQLEVGRGRRRRRTTGR